VIFGLIVFLRENGGFLESDDLFGFIPQGAQTTEGDARRKGRCGVECRLLCMCVFKGEKRVVHSYIE